ncbi:MAG: cytochrome C oxidase subunit IV family protein [Verrucomicrobiales bacterium]|nr:cytochrome C oxidase subunit IV family protein [Verrucomicrobiales bacterium]
MADSPEELAKHKKLYKYVGIWLIVFSCVALALGKIPFLDFGPPGATWEDIVIGLSVSCIKASLVALIFMHLNHEKGLIYKTLLFTFLFFVSLMGLTLFALADPIKESYDTLNTLKGILNFKS